MYVSFSVSGGSDYDFDVIDLANKYEVPVTIFIPVRNIEGKGAWDSFYGGLYISDIVEKYSSPYINVGCGGWDGIDLHGVSFKEWAHETIDAKNFLEDVFKKPVSSFLAEGDQVKEEFLSALVCTKTFEFVVTTGQISVPWVYRPEYSLEGVEKLMVLKSGNYHIHDNSSAWQEMGDEMDIFVKRCWHVGLKFVSLDQLYREYPF